MSFFVLFIMISIVDSDKFIYYNNLIFNALLSCMHNYNNIIITL